MVMLATKGDVAELPFLDATRYVAELKYDGDRAVLHYAGGRVTRLINRRGVDNLFRYPEVADIHLNCESCVLDGEIVVFDGNGQSKFHQGVDLRTHLENPYEIRRRSQELPVTFVAFDVIDIDGRAVSDLPLRKRKELLTSILPKDSDRVRLPLAFSSLLVAWEYVRQNNEEGIIVKDLESPYLDKRSPYWAKYKNVKETDIRFTSYEIHDKGITLTDGKHRVTCNGGQSGEVRRTIDRLGCAVCTIRHLGRTDAGHYRQPTFLKMAA